MAEGEAGRGGGGSQWAGRAGQGRGVWGRALVVSGVLRELPCPVKARSGSGRVPARSGDGPGPARVGDRETSPRGSGTLGAGAGRGRGAGGQRAGPRCSC